MPGSVASILETDFEAAVLQVEQPVLVYFWADWCGPCRLVSPSIDWLATNYSDRLKVIKMEADPNPTIVAQYQVQGLPALRLFNQGEVVASLEGALTRQKLVDLIEAHLIT